MNQKVAGNGILKENKKNWIEISVFAALVAIASAVTFWLFYRQCVESMQGTGLYHSDMKAYILEMQGLDSGYSFPYPVLFKLAATIHLVTASFTKYPEIFVFDTGEIIGFTFGHVWAQYCGNLPLAIGLAIGFPILVLLLNYKELHKDSIYRFSYILRIRGATGKPATVLLQQSFSSGCRHSLSRGAVPAVLQQMRRRFRTCSPRRN